MPVREGLIAYQQGKGEAFIFPQQNLRNFERLTDSTARQAQIQQGRKDKAAIARKKQRDDLLNYDIGIPTDRDNEVITQAVKAASDFIVKHGDNPDLFDPTSELHKEFKELRDFPVKGAERGIRDKEELDKAVLNITKIPNNSFIDKEGLIDSWQKWYNGEEGDRNVFSSDKGVRPNTFDFLNGGAWLDDYIRKQPLFKGTTSKLTTGGKIIETRSVEGRFHKLNDAGEVEVDDNGVPIIEVSDAEALKALQDTQWNGFVQRELEKEGKENSTESRIQFTKKEMLPSAFKHEAERLGKGLTPRQKKRGFGPTQEISSANNLITHGALMLTGSRGLLEAGFDEVVDTKEGKRTLRNVESLFKEIILGKDKKGKPITSTGVYLDPGRTGIFFVTDSKGKTREVTKDNIHSFFDSAAGSNSNYTLKTVDNLLDELGAFPGAVFRAEAVLRPDIREQREIAVQEEAFQEVAVGKAAKLTEVLSGTELSGFWEGFAFFSKNENREHGKTLQDEIFKDATVIIDGERYKDLKVKVNFAGSFQLINPETDAQIGKNLSNKELKELFDSGKAQFVPTRSYLQRIGKEETPVPTPAPAEEIPTISTQEDYDALPSGAQYKDSRGTIATKK